MRFYKFHKGRDRYQLVYPESWTCKRAGDPAREMNPNHLQVRLGEYGLYDLIHWKQVGPCCMDIEDVFDFISDYYSLGSIGDFITQLFDTEYMQNLLEAFESRRFGALIDIIDNIDECIELLIETIENFEALYENLESILADIKLLYQSIVELLEDIPDQLQEFVTLFDSLIDSLDNLAEIAEGFDEVIEAMQLRVTRYVDSYLEEFRIDNITSIVNLSSRLQQVFASIRERLEALLPSLELAVIFPNIDDLFSYERFFDLLEETAAEYFERKWDEADIEQEGILGNLEQVDNFFESLSAQELLGTLSDAVADELERQFSRHRDSTANRYRHRRLPANELRQIKGIVQEELRNALRDMIDAYSDFRNSIRQLYEIHQRLRSLDLKDFSPASILEDATTGCRSN